MLNHKCGTVAGSLEKGLRITICSALNTIFSEWGNILFNTTIAAAIADRLVENSEAFLIGGPTWRNPKNGQTAFQQ